METNIGLGLALLMALACMVFGIIAGATYEQNQMKCPSCTCENTKEIIVQNNTQQCPEPDCVNDLLNQNARLEMFKKEIVK